MNLSPFFHKSSRSLRHFCSRLFSATTTTQRASCQMSSVVVVVAVTMCHFASICTTCGSTARRRFSLSSSASRTTHATERTRSSTYGRCRSAATRTCLWIFNSPTWSSPTPPCTMFWPRSTWDVMKMPKRTKKMKTTKTNRWKLHAIHKEQS